ncbi:hypothetical protein Tco_0271581 [Tanacetum coccineum]
MDYEVAPHSGFYFTDDEMYSGADEQLEKITKTGRFKPDKGFMSAGEKSAPRTRQSSFRKKCLKKLIQASRKTKGQPSKSDGTAPMRVKNAREVPEYEIVATDFTGSVDITKGTFTIAFMPIGEPVYCHLCAKRGVRVCQSLASRVIESVGNGDLPCVTVVVRKVKWEGRG